MLEVIGASSIEDLFAQIPRELREADLRLPPGLSEQETRARTDALAATDRLPGPASFLGAGCYRHFVPAAVRALVSRSEFATAYTPYQPEVSQGTLEHIFEFQTCICEITGMDVSNASLYDGPSALAEGAFMALRATARGDRGIGGSASRGPHGAGHLRERARPSRSTLCPSTRAPARTAIPPLAEPAARGRRAAGPATQLPGSDRGPRAFGCGRARKRRAARGVGEPGAAGAARVSRRPGRRRRRG